MDTNNKYPPLNEYKRSLLRAWMEGIDIEYLDPTDNYWKVCPRDRCLSFHLHDRNYRLKPGQSHPVAVTHAIPPHLVGNPNSQDFTGLSQRFANAPVPLSVDVDESVPDDLAAAVKAYHDGTLSDEHIRTMMGYLRQYCTFRSAHKADQETFDELNAALDALGIVVESTYADAIKAEVARLTTERDELAGALENEKGLSMGLRTTSMAAMQKSKAEVERLRAELNGINAALGFPDATDLSQVIRGLRLNAKDLAADLETARQERDAANAKAASLAKACGDMESQRDHHAKLVEAARAAHAEEVRRAEHFKAALVAMPEITLHFKVKEDCYAWNAWKTNTFTPEGVPVEPDLKGAG